jgi:hypothetical protein
MSNGKAVDEVCDGKAHAAPNMEAILDWCRRNRPDIVNDISYLINAPDTLNQRGMLLLLVVGFAAGRLYQSEHPELSVHAYHR